jgi:hypothetical protein
MGDSIDSQGGLYVNNLHGRIGVKSPITLILVRRKHWELQSTQMSTGPPPRISPFVDA